MIIWNSFVYNTPCAMCWLWAFMYIYATTSAWYMRRWRAAAMPTNARLACTIWGPGLTIHMNVFNWCKRAMSTMPTTSYLYWLWVCVCVLRPHHKIIWKHVCIGTRFSLYFEFIIFSLWISNEKGCVCVCVGSFEHILSRPKMSSR